MAARSNEPEPSSFLSPRGSARDIEEGTAFAPKFDDAGLIACVVTDAGLGEVLMVAHMNAEALARTIETGEVWFYSRSRAKLWKKGETSGHIQKLIELRVDCDQDVLWLKVEQLGAGACHTGRRSCFYRAVVAAEPGAPPTLEFRDERVFDPRKVYGGPEDTSGSHL
jgi:phosphoribosyl-AMP cyclohydrolase